MSRNRSPGGAGARAAGAVLALLAAGGAAGQPTHLLAGSWDADAVVRFDASTGAYLGVFAPGVMNPHGMTYGPDGHLYVSSFSGLVHRFEGRSGSPMGVFADLTAGPPQPFLAGDLIFHNGLLYVLNA